MFVYLMGNDARRITWRWGRGPACSLFTRGDHSREKYGSIQLLGQGKYAVGWGWHPEVGRYNWPSGDVFSVMPPVLDVKRVEACILAAGQHAGIAMNEKHAFSGDVQEITPSQISMLSADDLARYQNELQTGLAAVANMAANTGRGTALYNIGLRFGALARHDARFNDIVQRELARLPGSASQGDVRDFTRGLAESKGLALLKTVAAREQRAAIIESLKPKGAAAPAQDLGELLAADIPPLTWLVEKFLPHDGTIALVGKPKVGKGFLALEMALAVCEGTSFWGLPCMATGVLLYMLEDGKRRIKQRVQQLRPNGPKPKKTFRIRYGADGPFHVHPDGSGGLLEDIRKHKHDYPDIGFVVIDMLKMVQGKADKNLDAYQATNQLVAPIARAAHELDIAILIVHHARKGEIDLDNVEDAVTGSNALTGMVDGTWTMWKKGDSGFITVQMRDSESFNVQLEKKENSAMWNPIENFGEYSGRGNSVKTRVLGILTAADCELTPRDVAIRLGIEDRVANARLHDLRKEGLVLSRSHGLYGIAGAQSRYDAILSAIMQTGIPVAVTPKLLEMHDPEGRYSRLGDLQATSFAFADDVIGAIERAKFADGKHALVNLHIHKLVVERKGVVWFFGAINRQQQPLPWAAQFPWDKAS